MENIVVIFVLYDIRCPMITKTIENKYCTQKKNIYCRKQLKSLTEESLTEKGRSVQTEELIV